jgi:hypothetical protein
MFLSPMCVFVFIFLYLSFSNVRFCLHVSLSFFLQCTFLSLSFFMFLYSMCVCVFYRPSFLSSNPFLLCHSPYLSLNRLSFSFHYYVCYFFCLSTCRSSQVCYFFHFVDNLFFDAFAFFHYLKLHLCVLTIFDQLLPCLYPHLILCFCLSFCLSFCLVVCFTIELESVCPSV